MRYSVRDPLKTTGLVVLLGVIMTILDTTIMNVAVNALACDFHTTLSTMQWVITGYLLALSMSIPVTGWAVGRFGTKAVWLTSLALFASGSALSAAAWSVGALIAFRAVQGLGGGLLMPVGQAMIAQAAGQDRMGRGMAMISVPAMLAPVLGPLLGGVIVENLDWRWLFLVNLPVCVIALLAAIKLLPGGRPSGDSRLDVLGLALLCPGLAALVFGLSEVGNGASLAHPALGGGLALVAVFAVRAGRTPGGLLDLRLFGDRTFAAAVAALICYSAALFGVTVLVPLYSQLAQGGDALDAGLLLAPMGAGAALTMPIAGKLTDRSGPRGVGAAGVVLASSFGVALLAVLLQVFTRAGVAEPFTYAFGCAIALAAVSLVPIALIGSSVWKESSSAPA